MRYVIVPCFALLATSSTYAADPYGNAGDFVDIAHEITEQSKLGDGETIRAIIRTNTNEEFRKYLVQFIDEKNQCSQQALEVVSKKGTDFIIREVRFTRQPRSKCQ